MIIKINGGKQFSTSLYNKNFQQIGYEWNVPRHNKGQMWQTSCSMVKAEKISAKIKNKTRMSMFTTFIQHNTEFPSQSNYAIKNRKNASTLE